MVGTLVDSGVSEIREDGSWTLYTLPPDLADPLVTNVCFGGADLDHAVHHVLEDRTPAAAPHGIAPARRSPSPPSRARARQSSRQ